RRAKYLDRRLLQADLPRVRPRDHPDRAKHAVSPDLHRWTTASQGSESDLERLLDGSVARRHAGGADLWFQGRPVAGRFRQPADGHGNVDRADRRPNFGTLEVEMTIDDPASYT